uniref:autotransporter outer membrane beta-barrel domain-containing protein n=1 Tax=uncultured Helicobacter sp. TaxID=175537 RepID=UPI00261ADC5E
SKKEQMQSLLSSGSNALVIESIMNGDDNPLKAGMALYISSGNVNVVSNALEYITGAFVGLNDSLYASHKVAQELKMIKTVNVENRMVRGKNPHLSKLEVAQLVRKAIGVRYASSDDEILLEDEESGVKDGELWVSFDGAMSFSESMGNASVYGFSGGYDTLLGEQKNYLLGFYFGYGYGSYSANFATNNSHNVSLGFYSRMSFENNEVDLILSQSIGLNTTRIDYGATDSVVAQMLKQDISYNFYTTDIEARYGYVFSVGDKENPYYFRPFGGINFAMIVNSEGRGDGEAPIGMDSLITYQLGVSAGVEMRKYFGENYLYLLPVLEKGLLNDGSGTKIGFVGSQSISYNLPYTVDTGISMYLGGQGNVGDNVAISGAVGVKVGLESKEILTNWNVGVRYKF